MYLIDIQYAVNQELAPDAASLQLWATEAMQQALTSAEVVIRIVDINEMTELNTTYRHKTGPTNVLSFPADLPPEIELETTILGDIIICAEVVNREAHEQHKPIEAHWAHMVIHGIFHLLGYDHINDDEATIMESHEIKVMQALGFPNPYEAEEDSQ